MEVERVEVIASLVRSLDTIPSDFIQPEHEQPGVTTFHGPAQEIPVIDLSNPDRHQLVSEVAAAATEWGIFQVVNHGVPAEVVDELQRAGKEFFGLPLKEKERFAMVEGSGSFEGYGTKMRKDVDGKKAWVDFFFHNIHPPSRVNYDIWPTNPASYRKANEEYARCLPGVVDEILRCLSVGAGLDEGELKRAVGGDDMEMLLKINFYPPCPRPDLVVGVAPHTDMSAVTVLVPNEVQGLQVFKDDHWFDAKYTPNAFIIHIGDQIEILTNGKYKSVLHRTTVNKDKTRMSWPVFCSPPAELVIGPLSQLVTNNNKAKFKAKMYKDYQYCKINKLPQ